VNEAVKQATGVRQNCSLGPYLFTIFTDGITVYISGENPYTWAGEKEIILALWPTDDMAIGAFIIVVL
jgi:hypothetical protein